MANSLAYPVKNLKKMSNSQAQHKVTASLSNASVTTWETRQEEYTGHTATQHPLKEGRSIPYLAEPVLLFPWKKTQEV